jgi:hypothetical protein
MDNRKPPISDNQIRSLITRAREAREQRFAEGSRQRLEKIITTKIRTAFIGALAAFEEHYGFLWGNDKESSNLTKEEREMQSLWIETRTQVLNNGNAQIRAAQNEISNHVIHWNRHHVELPYRPLPGDQE